MAKYVIDEADGNVYDQNHKLADPIELLAEINRLKDILIKYGYTE